MVLFAVITIPRYEYFTKRGHITCISLIREDDIVVGGREYTFRCTLLNLLLRSQTIRL